MHAHHLLQCAARPGYPPIYFRLARPTRLASWRCFRSIMWYAHANECFDDCRYAGEDISVHKSDGHRCYKRPSLAFLSNYFDCVISWVERRACPSKRRKRHSRVTCIWCVSITLRIHRISMYIATVFPKFNSSELSCSLRVQSLRQMFIYISER